MAILSVRQTLVLCRTAKPIVNILLSPDSPYCDQIYLQKLNGLIRKLQIQAGMKIARFLVDKSL